MVTQVVGASLSGVLGEIQFRLTSVRFISGVRAGQGSPCRPLLLECIHLARNTCV